MAAAAQGRVFGSLTDSKKSSTKYQQKIQKIKNPIKKKSNRARGGTAYGQYGACAPLV